MVYTCFVPEFYIWKTCLCSEQSILPVFIDGRSCYSWRFIMLFQNRTPMDSVQCSIRMFPYNVRLRTKTTAEVCKYPSLVVADWQFCSDCCNIPFLENGYGME